jgi:RND family efflux transporter MFP subunit
MALGAVVATGCKSAAEEAEPTPVASVEIQKAEEHSVDDALVAYGAVEFAPSHTHALTVQVESQVAERFVLPGTAVTRGQALLRLIPSATSRLDVDKATRDAAVADAEAQRVSRMREHGLATDSELRTARAAAETATALRKSLDTRIGSAGVTLRAPSAGVVDAFTAQPGDVIPAGTLILRIADPTALYVRVGLEPEESVRVKKGQSVTVSSLTANASSREARVGEVDRRVDATTRLASAVAEPVPNSGLVPGSSVRARIVLDTHEHAITVPRSAVLYEDEQPYVFIADGGKAHRRPVMTGLTDDTQIEIIKGLQAGEPVITGGNYELEDGMAIQTAKVAAAASEKGESPEKEPAAGDASDKKPAAGASSAKKAASDAS